MFLNLPTHKTTFVISPSHFDLGLNSSILFNKMPLHLTSPACLSSYVRKRERVSKQGFNVERSWFHNPGYQRSRLEGTRFQNNAAVSCIQPDVAQLHTGAMSAEYNIKICLGTEKKNHVYLHSFLYRFGHNKSEILRINHWHFPHFSTIYCGDCWSDNMGVVTATLHVRCHDDGTSGYHAICYHSSWLHMS